MSERPLFLADVAELISADAFDVVAALCLLNNGQALITASEVILFLEISQFIVLTGTLVLLQKAFCAILALADRANTLLTLSGVVAWAVWLRAGLVSRLLLSPLFLKFLPAQVQILDAQRKLFEAVTLGINGLVAVLLGTEHLTTRRQFQEDVLFHAGLAEVAGVCTIGYACLPTSFECVVADDTLVFQVHLVLKLAGEAASPLQ